MALIVIGEVEQEVYARLAQRISQITVLISERQLTAILDQLLEMHIDGINVMSGRPRFPNEYCSDSFTEGTIQSVIRNHAYVDVTEDDMLIVSKRALTSMNLMSAHLGLREAFRPEAPIAHIEYAKQFDALSAFGMYVAEGRTLRLYSLLDDYLITRVL